MRFNAFVWDLFRESEQGKSAIHRFESLDSQFLDTWFAGVGSSRTFEFTFKDEFKGSYPPGEVTFDVVDLVKDWAGKKRIGSADEAKDLYQQLCADGVPFEMADLKGHVKPVYYLGEDVEELYDYVAAISLGLHLAHPDFFLPCLWRLRFFQLEEIHHEFDIPIPPVPGRLSKEERGWYYFELNSVWQEFRKCHGLSPVEMSTFLYDFATPFATPTSREDMPAPAKAWMITGGSWDIEAADKATRDYVGPWGANAFARRGDILVLYLVRPKSCIHSIWRACSDGFVDPMSHYHSQAWVGDAIKTVPITLVELKAHPLFSKKSAVRANFQGPHGKAPLTFEEYEAILAMMSAKGQDLSELPRIPSMAGFPEVELSCERDVEIHLIEPFLQRLGYSDADWIRQMPVKMGRGERNYPDYAIGAVATRGEETAQMILESKYQLTSKRQFVDAFLQTKSYALRLQCKVMAMAAREGVWIFPPRNRTFEIDHYVQKTWGEIVQPDSFHAVSCLLGRDEILVRQR